MPCYDTESKDRDNCANEVLVFIASEDEDLGRITCGNAILSGTLPHKFTEILQNRKDLL